MIALGLYRLAWWTGGPLVFVVTLLLPFFRRHWADRWAFRVPAIEPGCTWVHAASVGEGRAAEAICDALTAQGSGHVLLRTATSLTGLENARGQHVAAPLPLDHPWVVRGWLDKIRPSILVLVESELWPNLLLGCLARGIPVVVAGARVGRGTRRLKRWCPGLFRRMVRGVGLWLAADEETAAWLQALVPGLVEVGGESKSDAIAASALVFSRPPIVAGSTRAGEEALLLACLGSLVDPPVLVLAPRHPSRFGQVADLLEQSGLRWTARSVSQNQLPADLQVLLLDSLGELAGLYEHAAVAFVGGTFQPHIGGHSPVEPASRGIPLVCGPFTGAHRGAWSRLEPYVALDPNGLARALQEALEAESAPVFELGASIRVASAVEANRRKASPTERRMRPLLAPLGWVWMALVSYRNLFWSLFPATQTGGPVISVGSLGSGGAGKTVVTEWLVDALREQGIPSAVVSRGYGRMRPGRFVRTSRERSDASWLGDEPAMLSARGCTVVSSPNRVAGAEVAFSQGAEVVVLDDAFQHRRIARDLDIVVMDGRWPEEGGAIPAGERREPLDSLGRADVVWVRDGGVPDRLLSVLRPGTLVVRARMVSVCWLRGNEEHPLEALEDRAVCAFAGIARPGRFLEHLAGLGVRVKGWRVFRDHHPYSEADVEQLLSWARGRPLVTTEKDRVRLPKDLEVWALRVRTEPYEGMTELQARLAEVAS